MERDDLDTWIRTGDLDELLREIDRACSRRDWDDVAMIRDRARAANETGHQLWPAASFAEYRLALEGSDEWAARVVDEGGGYLAPGPLSEVAAQRHPWAALGPLLPHGPARELVRQERVLRGEDCAGDTATGDTAAGDTATDDTAADGVSGSGLPVALTPWEGPYAVATYRPDGADFPRPDVATPRTPVDGSPRLDCPDGADGTRALLDTVRHWASHSTGTVRAVCVEGTADDAVASVIAARDDAAADQPGTVPLLAPVGPGTAIALIAWAAASGGAHGRRRGMATGRFEAWWCAAVLAGVEDDWPLDIGGAISELDWYVWSDGTPSIGWECRLAVADAVDGLAWALDAVDRIP